MKSSLILLIALFSYCELFGQLSWDKTRFELAATLEESAVEQEFSFQNTGNSPLTITAIKPTCGCTTAILDKRRYEPGEKGHILVNFTFGQRIGKQEKKVRVETSDGDFTDLELKIEIPVALMVQPRYLRWRRGDPPESKRVKIILDQANNVNVRRTQLDSDQFQTEVLPTADPWIKELVITPKQTDSMVSGHLEIIADKPALSPKTVTVYLRIH